MQISRPELLELVTLTQLAPLSNIINLNQAERRVLKSFLETCAQNPSAITIRESDHKKIAKIKDKLAASPPVRRNSSLLKRLLKAIGNIFGLRISSQSLQKMAQKVELREPPDTIKASLQAQSTLIHTLETDAPGIIAAAKDEIKKLETKIAEGLQEDMLHLHSDRKETPEGFVRDVGRGAPIISIIDGSKKRFQSHPKGSDTVENSTQYLDYLEGEFETIFRPEELSWKQLLQASAIQHNFNLLLTPLSTKILDWWVDGHQIDGQIFLDTALGSQKLTAEIVRDQSSGTITSLLIKFCGETPLNLHLSEPKPSLQAIGYFHSEMSFEISLKDRKVVMSDIKYDHTFFSGSMPKDVAL